MFKINVKRIVFIAILAVLAVGSPYLIAKYKSINYASGQVNIPTTTVVEAKPEATEATMISPDGKETLTVKKEVGETQTVNNINTTGGLYYTKTLPNSGSLTVPFNTWSPDNKYLFLKEEGENANYLVFSSTGKPFSDGSDFLSVTEAFAKKVEGYRLSEVTGWAAPTLIVVNTTDENGEKASFWFDITNQSFIRLSSKF